MKLPIQVTSEVGRLHTALVHEPGAEVDRMVPAMMEELLFDDILYGDRARDEHARFRRVLQHCGVELFDAADLFEESLAEEGAKDWLIDVMLEDLARGYREPLRDQSPAEIRTRLIEGVRTVDEGRSAVDVEDLYGIPPLPNYCFQRDTQIVLGNGVVFASMAARARHREALLARVIFQFHPQLAGSPVVFDPIKPQVSHPLFVAPERPHLEGGDVLVLSPDLLAVGLSERTNRTGIKALASALSRREGAPRWMIVVEVPRRRAYMHLDTLITPVDRDACLVFPPVILPGGPEPARVWEIDLHAKDLARKPAGPLLDCLATHGIDLEPISCGGSDAVRQQREQWTDGSNAIAVAPGVITLFDRNLETAAELDRHGFRIVEAESLLLGREEIDMENAGRVCVLISSHEISRARGGPHCLVHPLVREP